MRERVRGGERERMRERKCTFLRGLLTWRGGWLKPLPVKGLKPFLFMLILHFVTCEKWKSEKVDRGKGTDWWEGWERDKKETLLGGEGGGRGVNASGPFDHLIEILAAVTPPPPPRLVLLLVDKALDWLIDPYLWHPPCSTCVSVFVHATTLTYTASGDAILAQTDRLTLSRGQVTSRWFDEQIFCPEKHIRRQATRHDCLPSLLGDGDKLSEIL